MKYEQLVGFGRQSGVPIPSAVELNSEEYITALMGWSEYEAAAAWRGSDGILTQLKSLRPGPAKKAELLAWMAEIRTKADVLAMGGGTFFDVRARSERGSGAQGGRA